MFGDQSKAQTSLHVRIKSHVLGFMGYLIPVPALSILPHLSIEVCVSTMHTLELVHDLVENSGTGASNEELHFDHHLDHCVDVAAIVCTPHTYGCPNAIPDRDPPDEM
jgi:hypothetical protein